MATIATIWVKLSLDSKDYDKGLKSATQGTKAADKKMSGSLMGTVTQLAALSAGATAAAAVVWDLTSTASDLEESINKVNVVFGDSAAEIQDWSMNTASSMGISRQAALEAAGTYGNLFTSLGLAKDASADMSKSLVGLAADLASFNNADPSDVLNALRSGLSGEVEPLKRFGIAMNEVILKQKAMQLGFGNNLQALTEAQKLQVRYAVIMEQTATAQGDFARTSDGLANTTRTLKANFEDLKAIVGEAFLPNISDAATGLKDLTVWVKDNMDAIKKWGNVLGWVVAPTVKLSNAIANWRRGSQDAEETTQALGDQMSDVASAATEVPPAFDQATDAANKMEDALKAQSAAFKQILSNMFTLQSASDQYTKTVEDNEARLKEIQDEKVRLSLEQQKVQAAGNLTIARQNDFVRQQIALDKEAAQITADNAQALKDKEQASKKLIYQLLEQKAAQDGIINPEEFKFLQDTAVTMGLVDRASADAAIAASNAADDMWQAFEQPADQIQTVQDRLLDIPKNSPYRAQIIIDTVGGIPQFNAIGARYNATPGLSYSQQTALTHGFAGGTDSFMIPPGFPNDSFMAGFTSGEVISVTPASGGSTGNERSVVNNFNITGVVDKQMVNYLAQEVVKAQT